MNKSANELPKVAYGKGVGPDCHGLEGAECGMLENSTRTAPVCVECPYPYMGYSCEFRCFHGTATPPASDDSNDWTCECADCYSGTECDVNCGNQGTCNVDEETNTGTCDCGRGPLRGELCTEPGCLGDFGVDCSGRGVCGPGENGSLACNCEDNWSGDGCEDMNCFQDCNGQGTCTSYNFTAVDSDGNDVISWVTPFCTCDEGFFGAFCQYECVNGVVEVDEESGDTVCVCDSCFSGLTCEVECTGHGSCVDGVCQCPEESGRRGDLCEIRGCPGYTAAGEQCSGHGECQGILNDTTLQMTFTCLCDLGWNGTRCHVASCPDDCNNRGDCLTNAVVPYCANCAEGWFGEACDVPCYGEVLPNDEGGAFFSSLWFLRL